MEAPFPRTCFICYQRGAQGGGRYEELRLDWLPLGIKAATKGMYFIQVGIHVP